MAELKADIMESGSLKLNYFEVLTSLISEVSTLKIKLFQL